MPPKRPSSSAVATTSIAVAGAMPPSRMVRTHSSATATPSAPSKAPPSGTVSRCEPAITQGPAAGPKRPKTLAAASLVTASPSAAISPANQRRTAMSASENPGRLKPPVSGLRPKRLMPSSSFCRRERSMAKIWADMKPR